MRKMFQIIAVIAAVVVVGLGIGWFACAGWRIVATTYADDVSSTAAITDVRITGGSVWLELRSSSEPGVRIHRKVSYLNPFHGRPGATHRIDGSTLELSDDNAPFSAITYEVSVPAGVRVTADVGTGSLDLRGVSTVDARLGTGSVAVADATGDLTARVGTGQITGSGLRSGAVVATTGTGQISLQLEAPADVQASVSTGDVNVKVPESTYRVDASSKLGKVLLGIPNDPSGLYHIALRSDMGQVTLAAS